LIFSELISHPGLLEALATLGHVVPTPVQAEAIPAALTGRDVLATADTGTGKTGAFLLPSLQRLLDADAVREGRRPVDPRVLVISPTRELARQSAQAARMYRGRLRLNVVDIVGGMPFQPQARDLSRPVDVLIATPGRLLDHVARRNVTLSEVEVLVLDEADRMLDMGFAEDIDTIAQMCPKTRQTLLFTATLDRRMETVARRLLNDNVVRVAIQSMPENAPKIEQRVIVVDDLSHKKRLLEHFATAEEVSKAIVFAATKRDTEELAAELEAAGHAVVALHGDMRQRDRLKALTQLRDGRVRMLVATDVAARGIDVRDISHVINFDLPRDPEDYVHRIGRTGRAGAEGIAISFAARPDRAALSAIERLVGERIPVHVIEGLEARVRFDAPVRPRASGPRDGARFNKGGSSGRNAGPSSSAKPAPRRGVVARDGGDWAPRAKRV